MLPGGLGLCMKVFTLYQRPVTKPADFHQYHPRSCFSLCTQQSILFLQQVNTLLILRKKMIRIIYCLFIYLFIYCGLWRLTSRPTGHGLKRELFMQALYEFKIRMSDMDRSGQPRSRYTCQSDHVLGNYSEQSDSSSLGRYLLRSMQVENSVM